MDTPNTITFMIAGYAVIFSAVVAYVISLALRFRNLRADERMLEDIKEIQPERD